MSNTQILSQPAIIVNAPVFLKALRRVTSTLAIRNDDIHSATLQAVHIRISDNCVLLESTDGTSLSQATVKADVNSQLSGLNFLLNGKFAKQVSKAPTKYGHQLTIIPVFKNDQYQGSTTMIADDGQQMVDNLRHELSGATYPELDSVIPSRGEKASFTTTKGQLYSILQELAKLTVGLADKTVILSLQGEKHPLLGKWIGGRQSIRFFVKKYQKS